MFLTTNLSHQEAWSSVWDSDKTNSHKKKPVLSQSIVVLTIDFELSVTSYSRWPVVTSSISTGVVEV